jgi:hypothetical protein
MSSPIYTPNKEGEMNEIERSPSLKTSTGNERSAYSDVEKSASRSKNGSDNDIDTNSVAKFSTLSRRSTKSPLTSRRSIAHIDDSAETGEEVSERVKQDLLARSLLGDISAGQLSHLRETSQDLRIDATPAEKHAAVTDEIVATPPIFNEKAAVPAVLATKQVSGASRTSTKGPILHNIWLTFKFLLKVWAVMIIVGIIGLFLYFQWRKNMVIGAVSSVSSYAPRRLQGGVTWAP